LFALVAAGGIAFDYARVASMDSELQNAADQAALAAASQLDGQTGACVRAAAAANALLANHTLMANEPGTVGMQVVIPATGVADCTGNANIRFYQSYDQAADTFGTASDADTNARVVWVSVTPRESFFALTPIVAAFRSGPIGAQAIASLGSAICKNPPVMLCNPEEPTGNFDELLPYTPPAGIGLRLITGDASAPGNFGWLTAYDGAGNLINGANELKKQIGYDVPPSQCQPAGTVTTKTGMTSSVLDAFNSRFDIYANGNSTCPGGTSSCSAALNTRKDLVCDPNNSNSACRNNNWDEASNPYHPASTSALPTNGSQDPAIMGYPKDLCHAVRKQANTCGITGNGDWDRDAFFRVNYGWDHSTWMAQTGLSATATRFQVYKWEEANPNLGSKGISFPQIISSSEAAFSIPATGHQSTGTPDRRRISIAVLNCRALNAGGKTTAPVATWLDSFLVEPAWQRGPNAPAQIFTDQKDVYVEVIGATHVGSGNAQTVRRDVPYLLK
jgi:Flp pilus assembly protein TadG